MTSAYAYSVSSYSSVLSDADLAVMWRSAPRRSLLSPIVQAAAPAAESLAAESSTTARGDDRNSDQKWDFDAASPSGGGSPIDPISPPAARKVTPLWHVSRPRGMSRPARPAEMAEMGDQIRNMAAQLAAGTCQWLHLIERFDRENGWAGVGIASCAAWLSWTCSVSRSTAREYVRIARALTALPLVDAAFAGGRLSYSKVRAVVRVAAHVDEAILLQQAECQTVSQLESTIRALRRGDGWQQEKHRRAS